MNLQQILDKVARLQPPSEAVPVVPESELIALYVRSVRRLQHWKVSTLASLADVSISTIERVERGEKVSVEKLDRVAVALGLERGYLTNPRCAAPAEEVEAGFQAWANIEIVPVAPLRLPSQVRKAAKCHAYLLHHPNVPLEMLDGLRSLAEWLDLVAFSLGKPSTSPRHKESRRDFYKEVLDCVASLERSGLTILLGTMAAPRDLIPEWNMAIVSATLRATDPGARKRTHIFVDRRCAQIRLQPESIS